MSRLRIWMVAPQFRPLVGGYERAAERLSVALAARGHEVTVFAERRDKSWARREAFDGVRLERYACSTRPGLHVASSVLSLAWILLRRGREADVLHLHQYGPLVSLCVLYGRLTGAPVVLKMTSTGVMGPTQVLGKLRFSRLMFGLHRRVDACLVTSGSAAEEARALGIPPERIHAIPNGVDTERFAPVDPDEREAAKRALELSPAPLVLFVGRMVPEKEPDLLLEAFGRVRTSIPGATLAMLGTGPLLDAVRERIEALGLGGSVRAPGSVADPLGWYRAADLFVLSSKLEGLSNSLIEALACGLPVVSTRVSGSVDVFERGDVGAMVEVGDAAALAEAMVALLGDAERRAACGGEARRQALEVYSLEAVTSAVESLYRRLLAPEP